MTLRTRLTLMVLVLVMGAALVMAVASYGVVRSTTYANATGAIHRDLQQHESAIENGGRVPGDDGGGNTLRPDGAFFPTALGFSTGSLQTVLWVRSAGDFLQGYSPPVLTPSQITSATNGPILVNSPIPYLVQTELTTLPAGSQETVNLPGRTVVIPGGTHYYYIVAAPVQVETEHLHKVALVLFFGVLLVSAIGALLAWLLVRASMKPVDSMIDVAGDIAKGDLDRRVPDVKEGTELGDLASSLNAMIASMQLSLHEREESEQTMRRFLGDASHELRTPLTVIRGYAELLGNEAQLDDAQRARAIQRLDTESTRMETLVLDLLNLARLDEHRPLMLKPVDIAQLIRDALDDLRLQQPERDITISAPPTAIVRGDETRLRQVMANLVGNIRSYTPDNSAVHANVTIANEQKWHDDALDVVLTLDDSGPGIPAEQYELARQRFGRLDSSRARSTGGFGLGLSIVDAVVSAHDGDFSLAESPTRGLRVIVRLPVDGPADVVEEDTPVLRPDAKPSDGVPPTARPATTMASDDMQPDNVGA